MNWRTRLAFSLTIALAVGCGSTPSLPDLSVSLTGCRYPSVCVQANCECSNATGGARGCITCDSHDPIRTPLGNCDPCNSDSICLEAAQLCVGRAPDPCPGTGARCLPPVDGGTGCERDGGTPPQMVARPTDGGVPATEPHCPLVDDVCCRGSLPDAALDGPPASG